MNVTGDLVFPAAIDLNTLDRDIRTAESMVSDFADSAERRLSSIRPPSVGVSSGGGGQGGAESAAASLGAATGPLLASFSAIGPMLASSIAGAIGPIKGTMQEIGKAISNQLDKQGKFNRLNADIVQTKDNWKIRIVEMEKDFRHFSDGLKLKMSKLPPGSVVPPGDLAELNRLKAGLEGAKKTQEEFTKSSARALQNITGMQSALSSFRGRAKRYVGGDGGDGGGVGGGGGALGRVATSILPRSIGGMKALGSATGAASTAAKGLGFVLTGALGPIGLLFAAGTALHSFLKGGVKSASDLDETIARTNIVLGESSPAVQKFADEMGTKFGFVKGVTLDTAASLSGLGRSLGQLKGEKLGAFSIRFTKLAAELSAFSHVDMGEAADAIRIGLTGNQSDLLKQRGVIIDEQTTKDYAYAHGIATVNAELNEQQKFAARTGQIMRGLAKVDGYLETSQGGAAGQARILWGNLSNLGTLLGSVVLPTITEGIKLLNEFGGRAMKAFEDNKSAVESWKNTFLDAFDWVVATVHHLPEAFEIASLIIEEKLINIGAYLNIIGPNAEMLGTYIAKNWASLMIDGFMAVGRAILNLYKNFFNFQKSLLAFFQDPTKGFEFKWTDLLDRFKAATEKFPDILQPVLVDMSGKIAEVARPITDEVNARRAARALGPAAAKKLGDQEIDPETAKKGKGSKEKTLGAALELGSKEAYSSVANAVSQPPKAMDRIAKSGDETARNTKVMADHLARFNNPPKDRRVRMVLRP